VIAGDENRVMIDLKKRNAEAADKKRNMMDGDETSDLGSRDQKKTWQLVVALDYVYLQTFCM
jgi:hypothetical protein